MSDPATRPSPTEMCGLCSSPCGIPSFYKDGQPYYRCSACGFAFQKPAYNLNLLAEIGQFDGAYLQYLDESAEDRLNFDDLVSWMATFRVIAGTALDHGTGSGKFPRYLRRRGVESFGLEPSKALFEHYLMNESFFFNCTVEELLDRGYAEKFELVTAFDVLEHVERPVEFLECACRLLAPGGFLYLSTPDVDSATARLFGRHWHFYNKWHLSFVPELMISRIVAREGLAKAGFARRGRLRSLRYVLDYLFTFALGRPFSVPAMLDSVVLRLNLHDTMYVVLRKGESS